MEANTKRLTDLDEIRRMTEAVVEEERAEFQTEPELEPGDGGNGHDTDQAEEYPKHGFSSQFVMDCLFSEEDGDARLYIELHRGRFCYDSAAGVWYKWAGNYWAEDFLNEALAGIEEVILIYGTEAQRQAWQRLKAEKSGDEKKAEKCQAKENTLYRRIRKLQKLDRKKHVLELARIGVDGLGITGEEWDRDPWLFAVKNGVVDLKTGTLRPGRPEDYIKTVAPVEWQGLDAPAPTWEKFLSGIFDGNDELTAYLQRLFGYCLTGLTVEHIFPIFYGVGRNGKGTLFEVLAHVLGPYAGPTEAELILKQKMTRQSGGPASDILYLRSKRLVWISETDEGRRLNAGKVKWLSGGDTLTGRGVYEKRQIHFRPSHKLMILTNHRPHADASDYALFQRLHLIPFNLSFVNEPTKAYERKADKILLEKMKVEGPGILAWLIRGGMVWQKQGLDPPEAVKAATKSYQVDEDLIGKFIEEYCVLDLDQKETGGRLYGAYKAWAENMGLKPITGVKFGNEMQVRFRSESKRNRVYFGIRLIHQVD